MSIPQITELADGYEYNWTDEKLIIKASRVRVHTSDGRVTGELLITGQNNKAIYPQTSFNFTSDRTRGSLIKTLTERGGQWKWDDIINQLCLSVVERARQGEPVQELWTCDEIEAPEFLLEPLIYKGLPTVIFGEKAVCKSTISLLVYSCLILPWTDNPLSWKAPVHPVKVLLADWEVNADVAKYNLKRIQQGMGLPHFPLIYRRCKLPLVDDIEQIKKHLDDTGAEVLIIDSLGFAAAGDLNNADQALRFANALRQLNCAAFIIAQTSKDRKSKGKSVYGSTFFEYFSRNIFELRKTREDNEDSFDIAIFNTYCNLGRRAKPMGYHIQFDDIKKTVHIEQAEITAADLVERLGTWSRIYDKLKTQTWKAKELSDELGISLDLASRTLKRYQQKGQVAKLPDGSWGLVARHEEVSS